MEENLINNSQRGPEQKWLGDLPAEKVKLFNKQFFGEGRKGVRMASHFKKGTYRPSPMKAVEIRTWWRAHGFEVTLHQILPSVYGEKDDGPNGG